MFKTTLKLPIRIAYKKKKEGSARLPKSYFLNLNIYRNLDMFSNNKLKKVFKEIVLEKLEEQNIEKDLMLKKIRVDYEIFFPDKRERDLMNVGCIVDKFALDAIVAWGLIIDDNHLFITDQSFKFGGYDDDKKGYALMTITEVEK